MIKKMTNKEYHAADGLSKSMMDKLAKSPAHLKYAMENPEPQTEVMLLGSLLHTMILEPDLLDKEYVKLPDFNRRTAEGRQQYADFIEQNSEKYIITQDQLDLATIWANAIKNHPKAGRYFSEDGSNEVSIFWTDVATNELCKARLDRIVDDVIIDIKTANSAQQDDFERKAYSLGYYRQASWFCEAYEREFGVPPKAFLFVVVEKTPPYNVVIYQIDQFSLEIGENENHKLLNTYHYCKESNNWYGYDGPLAEIQNLTLPNYVIAKNMEEI